VAGDQGIMFGYACNETDVLMPAPIYYSHKILRLMAEDRKSVKLKNIEPDSKSQITIEYKMENHHQLNLLLYQLSIRQMLINLKLESLLNLILKSLFQKIL